MVTITLYEAAESFGISSRTGVHPEVKTHRDVQIFAGEVGEAAIPIHLKGVTLYCSGR